MRKSALNNALCTVVGLDIHFPTGCILSLSSYEKVIKQKMDAFVTLCRRTSCASKTA